MPKCLKWLKQPKHAILAILRRELAELLPIPEKFLLFNSLALNSLMVFLEVLLYLSAQLLLYLLPNHQNIKATMESSPKIHRELNTRS